MRHTQIIAEVNYGTKWESLTCVTWSGKILWKLTKTDATERTKWE